MAKEETKVARFIGTSLCKKNPTNSNELQKSELSSNISFQLEPFLPQTFLKQSTN